MFEWKLLYGLPSDLKMDSKFVEFLSIHILFSPVQLLFILQYFSGPVFITVSILVNNLDNCLPEPAIK